MTYMNRSERIKKSESDGQRLKEALHINSSLSAIGKVKLETMRMLNQFKLGGNVTGSRQWCSVYTLSR